ncbi:MAG: monovalent cation/H(+) antiporter subunit G [Candidatus Aenigmarchaeota archaeon]|nr:monovalent cation/H(+) antiporter subunit G [Candidatus Aenigmarchaeota archaeon]
MITLGIVIMLLGGVFAIIGAIGLIRFPDVYARSHAQTVVTVGGTCLVLIGVMIDYYQTLLLVKCVFLIIFIFLTSPAGTHAITKAAYLSGVKPKVKKDEWKG